MATVPYLTEDQIRKNYANEYNLYNSQRKAEADRASAAANQQYDNMQRSNYVDYRMNQRDMPEQLARQGITGGASETSLLRGQTNYENNRAATELQRGSRLGDINNAYLDAIRTYRMTADREMNDKIEQNQQLRANYEKQLQQEAEQRYANTISGYDSISGIDKEIASIQKSGKDTWRIAYLRARRAELVAAQKAEQEALASSSGGGGGGGYSRGGNSGGSSPYDNPTKPSGSNKIGSSVTARGKAVSGTSLGGRFKKQRTAPKSFGRNAYLRLFR